MRIAHRSSRDSSPVNLAVALTHDRHTVGKNAPVIIFLNLHYVNHHWDCMGAPGGTGRRAAGVHHWDIVALLLGANVGIYLLNNCLGLEYMGAGSVDVSVR